MDIYKWRCLFDFERMKVMFPWDFPPFNKDTLKNLQRMRPDEVEKYVNEVVGRMFPPEMQQMSFGMGANSSKVQPDQKKETQNRLHANVFETHDYVYVQIPITNEKWLEELKMYHTSNQLIIEHIPEWENKQIITLPAIVRKKGAKASFRDGTLEIKLLKNMDMQYSEINVTEY